MGVTPLHSNRTSVFRSVNGAEDRPTAGLRGAKASPVGVQA